MIGETLRLVAATTVGVVAGVLLYDQALNDRVEPTVSAHAALAARQMTAEPVAEPVAAPTAATLPSVARWEPTIAELNHIADRLQTVFRQRSGSSDQPQRLPEEQAEQSDPGAERVAVNLLEPSPQLNSGLDFVAQKVATGSWGAGDRDAFNTHLKGLSVAEQDALLSRLVGALNSGAIVADLEHPPF